jgi:hypothetical protein
VYEPEPKVIEGQALRAESVIATDDDVVEASKLARYKIGFCSESIKCVVKLNCARVVCDRGIWRCGRVHKGNVGDVVYGIDQCKVFGYESLAHDEIGLEVTLDYVMDLPSCL